MSDVRTGFAYIDGHTGIGHQVDTEAEARQRAEETEGSPVIYVHLDDIAAFKAS